MTLSLVMTFSARENPGGAIYNYFQKLNEKDLENIRIEIQSSVISS